MLLAKIKAALSQYQLSDLLASMAEHSLFGTTDPHMYSVITINIFITTCIHINSSLFCECVLSAVYTLCPTRLQVIDQNIHVQFWTIRHMYSLCRPANHPVFSGTIPEIQAVSRCPECLFENPGF